MTKFAILALALALSSGAVAQTPPDLKPTTDEGKIADALRAAPPFITKGATIVDWPMSEGAGGMKMGSTYRVLRQGTTQWTCLPGISLYPHDEPMCVDAVFMKWFKQSIAGEKAPKVTQVGVSYMYNGAWVPDLKGNAPNSPDHLFHVGPHVMIITPNEDGFEAFSHDGSDGGPYVAHLPKHTGLYLVIPVQQWDAQ